MKKIIGALTLLLLSFSVNAQNRETAEIYFEQGSSFIDRGYVINGDMLDRLANKLTKFVQDSTITINKINIDSYTSPESGLELNDNLSMRRAEVVRDYINSLELNIPDSIINLSSNGVAWAELRKVVSDSDIPEKDDIVRIIDEVPEETWAKIPTSRWLQLVDSRNKHLMDLKYGNPYRYMMQHIFPSLRKSSVVTIYYKREVAPIIEEVVDVEEIEEVVEEVIKEPEVIIEEPVEPIIKPLFAIKSNLLYDAVSVANLELEVPIGQRWSIAGEWIFPWWKSNKADWTTQLLSGHITAKYWFGDRDNFDVLTGWYLGLNGGASKYDFQIFNNDGIQGEAFDVGLQAGYAHTINKRGNLRLEYSLGVGYLQSDYKKYVKTPDTEFGDIKVFNYPWETKRRVWIGPTSAKVSLVWLLNYKSTKQKGE